MFFVPHPHPGGEIPSGKGALCRVTFLFGGSVIRISSAAEPLSDEEQLVPNRVTEKAILQKCGMPQFCKMAFFGGLTLFYDTVL